MTPTESAASSTAPPLPSFREALAYWLKLGFISFGGPAGQIALMHRELVEKRRWITDEHFLHALNFCMFLPGPEAQQLATYLGWRLHGAKGGIAAGSLFVLPSVVILYALSWLYMTQGSVGWVAALFHGLVPAVIAIVATAMLRIGRRALTTPALWILALASFAAIFFGKVSFVIIIAAAALIGWLGTRWAPSQFPAGKKHSTTSGSVTAQNFLVLPPSPNATWLRTLVVCATCLILWWTPALFAGLWRGWDSTLFHQGLFFSKAALVTFGGAYAVLPYVAQQAVDEFGWLSHSQMMSGLALAETTPGPLIMVLQFVGFAGGWNHPEGWPPLAAATAGALLTTWATFLPCFLFIFLGAPHVERLYEQKALAAALTGVTAAVSGVILNLAVQFGLHGLWPAAGHLDVFVACITVAAFVALERFEASDLMVITGCALLGLLAWLSGIA